MKTLLLVSIIIGIGISLVALTFVYQRIQNCEAEEGSITGSLECDKSQYAIMTELFQKKYDVIRATHIDRVDGAITESMATNQYGDTITLVIKENLNGPYYAEITCKHKDSKSIQTITKDIVGYLQNERCFVPILQETDSLDSLSLSKINQSELVLVQKEEGGYNSIYSPTMKDVNYINDDSIEITFAKTKFTDYIPNYFEFTKTIHKGGAFIAMCKENEKGVRYSVVLQLTSINSTFVSFDHYEVDLPKAVECKYPEIIQNSFDIEWDIPNMK